MKNKQTDILSFQTHPVSKLVRVRGESFDSRDKIKKEAAKDKDHSSPSSSNICKGLENDPEACQVLKDAIGQGESHE